MLARLEGELDVETATGASRTWGEHRRIAAALVAALLVHALALIYVRLPERADPDVQAAPLLDVQLVRVVAPAPEVTSEPDEAQAPTQAAIEQPAETPQAPSPAVQPAITQVEAAVDPTPTTAPPPEATARLSLERPAQWDEFFLSEFDEKLAYHRPEFRQRLDEREAAKARQAIVGERARVREGLSVEAYNEINDDPNHIKTAQGCFDLKADPGDPLGPPRWWRTGCRELRVPDFSQPPLEYDEVGRAIPNSTIAR